MSVVSSITITAPEPSIDPADAGGAALERDVELVGQEPRCRTATGHERLELVAVADALAELVAVDQVAERGRAVDDLVHAGPLDVARHGDHARARRRLGADRGVGGRAVERDERQVRQRLDVVDDRRLAVQPDRGREVRRLEARHAALALERLDQRRLLAHHVGAGAPVQDDVDAEVRCRGCSCRCSRRRTRR